MGDKTTMISLDEIGSVSINDHIIVLSKRESEKVK